MDCSWLILCILRTFRGCTSHRVVHGHGPHGHTSHALLFVDQSKKNQLAIHSGWLAAAAGEGLYLFTAAICVSQILGKIIVFSNQPNADTQSDIVNERMHSKHSWALANEFSTISRFCMALLLLLVSKGKPSARTYRSHNFYATSIQTGVTLVAAMVSPCFSVQVWQQQQQQQ